MTWSRAFSVVAMVTALCLTNNANNPIEINIPEPPPPPPPPIMNERQRIEQMASRGEIRSMMCEITAYDETVGPITATGTKPRPGIVAVDPSVIPLNSVLYIDGVGIVVAEDVDDEVGNVVDLFIQKNEDAWAWGRQHRKVYVLKEGNGRQ